MWALVVLVIAIILLMIFKERFGETQRYLGLASHNDDLDTNALIKSELKYGMDRVW